MWPTFDEAPPMSPATLARMLALVGPGEGWELKRRVLAWICTDPGGCWWDTGRATRDLGYDRPASLRHALAELIDDRVVLAEGERRRWVEVNPNPLAWRRVPWRVGDRHEGHRAAVAELHERAWREVSTKELREVARRLYRAPRGARYPFAIARVMGRAISDELDGRIAHPRVRDTGAEVIDFRPPGARATDGDPARWGARNGGGAGEEVFPSSGDAQKPAPQRPDGRAGAGRERRPHESSDELRAAFLAATRGSLFNVVAGSEPDDRLAAIERDVGTEAAVAALAGGIPPEHRPRGKPYPPIEWLRGRVLGDVASDDGTTDDREQRRSALTERANEHGAVLARWKAGKLELTDDLAEWHQHQLASCERELEALDAPAPERGGREAAS